MCFYINPLNVYLRVKLAAFFSFLKAVGDSRLLSEYITDISVGVK